MSDPNILKSKTDPNYVLPDGSFAQMFGEKLASWDSDSIALIDPNTAEQVTYGELHSKAQHFARSLLQLGVTKHDVICPFVDNCIEAVIGITAAIYLGVPLGPVSQFCRKYDFAKSIKACHGKVLFMVADKAQVLLDTLDDPELAPLLSSLHLVVEFNSLQPNASLTNHSGLKSAKISTLQKAIGSENGLLDQIPHFPLLEPEKEPFYYTSTSGTTGPPKRAIQSQRSFKACVSAEFFPPKPGFRYTQWASLGHGTGIISLTMALNAGYTAMLFRSNKVAEIMAAIETFGINGLLVTRDVASLMTTEKFAEKYNLRSLEVIFCTSSKLPDFLVDSLFDQLPGVRIKNAYGSSECFGAMGVPEREQTRQNYKYGNCGHIAPGMQLKVVDINDGRSLPANESGEVCFKGAQVFVGYLDNPEATKQALDDDGWYHSGDYGYYDADGCLFITERLKEIIKFGYFSLVPAEIEELFQKHPAVAASVVVGVPHPVDCNWPRAYVQLKGEAQGITEQDLVDYVAANLGSIKRLKAGVRFVGQMPRTEMGKIERAYFKNLVKDEVIGV